MFLASTPVRGLPAPSGNPSYCFCTSQGVLSLEGQEINVLNACKDIGLAGNTRKTKYMEIGRHRGVIANAHIKIDVNSFEKVKTFKYLGSLVTNQHSIEEEIKCRLKAGN